VLLETDFPTQCDATPSLLIREPDQWVLVNKFCFFSGGPINTEEDVYYQADFDGNPIYMLAFLSPSLTPEELYKLTESGPNNEPGLKTVAEVQDVESVYDLTERDFDDLKLYHLGPCRALPQYILQPSAWVKVLPPHFLAARQQAMLRAQDYESRFESVAPPPGPESPQIPIQNVGGDILPADPAEPPEQQMAMGPPEGADFEELDAANPTAPGTELQREVEEEGAFHNTQPTENGLAHDVVSPSGDVDGPVITSFTNSSGMDPPEDEPPSLKKESMAENRAGDPEPAQLAEQNASFSHGFFTVQQPLQVATQSHMIGPDGFPDQYVSPESLSQGFQEYFQDDAPDNEQYFQGMHGSNTPEQYFQEAPGSPDNDQYFENQQQFEDENYFRQGPRSPESGEYFTVGVSTAPRDPDVSDMPESPFAPSDPNDEEFYAPEEKKCGIEKEEVDSQLDNSADVIKRDGEKFFIDTAYKTRHLYEDAPGSLPFSPGEASANSGFDSHSHQSPALRGAHEILKRNRRRRLEEMSSPQTSLQSPSHFAGGHPDPAFSEASVDTWEESGSEVTGSAISGSSAWTDNSGPPADRTSRRALILQMARARMKNNKESPTKQSMMAAGTGEEDGSKTVSTDFDLTGDLD